MLVPTIPRAFSTILGDISSRHVIASACVSVVLLKVIMSSTNWLLLIFNCDSFCRFNSSGKGA